MAARGAAELLMTPWEIKQGFKQAVCEMVTRNLSLAVAHVLSFLPRLYVSHTGYIIPQSPVV